MRTHSRAAYASADVTLCVLRWSAAASFPVVAAAAAVMATARALSSTTPTAAA
uniref:Uncharacterized protein n=1 Tax=Arundo donax TaxID=35708 RepID=A0A0A9H2K5_ARUDO